MNDLEQALRATFTTVAEAEPVPRLPDCHTLVGSESALDAFLDETFESVVDIRRTAPRRRVLAGIAALAILGGGLSVAAAAGLPVLPRSVVQALGWTPVPGAYNAYPATARVLLTEPGPDGRTLQLWGAFANDGGYCVSLTPSISTGPTAPNGFDVRRAVDGSGVEAGSCGDLVGSTYWNTFGDELTSASGGSGPYWFIVRAAGAATVRLEFDDGTTRALPTGNGYTAGWLTHRETGLHPVLVGRTASGHVMGTLRLP